MVPLQPQITILLQRCSPSAASKRLAALLVGMLTGLLVGCGTTTQRTATEQMLMSDAVDMSISRIDFRPLSGKTAFLDTTFIRPSGVPGVMPPQLQGFVNADYVVSSLRQALFAAQCELVDDRNQAEVIIEPRVGTLGTNGHDMVYGLPQTNSLAQAAASLSGGSLFPAIPEISIGRSNSQFGLAKIALFAYERETRDPVWQSGISKSESTAKNSWFMGAGPFQRGSIYDGYRFAGSDLKRKGRQPQDAQQAIPYNSEHVFSPRPPIVHMAEQPASSQNSENPANLK